MTLDPTCPYCAANVSREAHYCDQCGTPLARSGQKRRKRIQRLMRWSWALIALICTVSLITSLLLLRSYLPFMAWGAPAHQVSVPDLPPGMIDYEPELAKEAPFSVDLGMLDARDRALVESIQPAIVSVTAHGARGTSTGTGFLFDESGRVVTSYHVIESADRIEVVDSAGERHRAHKHQHEANRDLAMLYVPTLAGQKPLQLASRTERVEPGDRAFVFGSPMGQGASHLAGVVGGVGQQVRCEDRPFYDLMTLTAVVAKGNSGGPVVDPDTGQVIGVVVCRTDPVHGHGLSYAIPTRAIVEMLETWAGLANPTAVAPVNRAPRTVPVRIGLLGSLTGADATIGTPLAQGASLAIREMSSTLLALGYDVDLKYYDTKGRSDLATEMGTRARYDQDLVAVVSTLDSKAAEAVMPLLRVDAIPLLAPFHTDPQMTSHGWTNYFRLLAADDQQAQAAVSFLTAKGIRSVYVVDEGTEYSRPFATAFIEAAKSEGIQVIARDFVVDEVAPAVGQRIAEARPGAIYAAGHAAALAPVLEEAAKKGFAGIVVGPDGMNDPRLVAQMETESFYFTSAIRPMPEAFRKRFESAYQTPATPEAALGYDATRIILEALERYGKDNPGHVPGRAHMPRLLRENIGFTGWMVTATFDQLGENVEAPVYVFGWEGYDPQLVWTHTP